MIREEIMKKPMSVFQRLFGFLVMLTFTFGLIACSGDDGEPGKDGVPIGVDITNATSIYAEIMREITPHKHTLKSKT